VVLAFAGTATVNRPPAPLTAVATGVKDVSPATRAVIVTESPTRGPPLEASDPASRIESPNVAVSGPPRVTVELLAARAP